MINKRFLQQVNLKRVIWKRRDFATGHEWIFAADNGKLCNEYLAMNDKQREQI